MIERARLDAVGGCRVLNAQAHRGQAVQRTGLGVQDAHVRPIEFVAGAKQKIRIHCLHVDGKVRRVVHGVDHQERAHRARQAPRERQVVDGAQRVR